MQRRRRGNEAGSRNRIWLIIIEEGEAQEGAEAGRVGGGGFGDEAAGMGEVDVGLGGDAREIEARIVTVTGEAVAGVAAVGRNQADHAVAESAAFHVAFDGGGGIVGERVGAREEEHGGRAGDVVERPELGGAGDEVEAFAERADVGEQVVTDEAHDFPERFAGGELRGEGEAAEERAVDGRVEFADDVAFHAEPAGGIHGTATVEPLRGFEPVAELAGIFVEPEVAENEREGAGGRVIFGELMVIEVVERGVVDVADIDDRSRRIGEVGGGGFATDDGHRVDGEEDATGEEFVFVRAAGVGEDRGERCHVGDDVRCEESARNGGT